MEPCIGGVAGGERHECLFVSPCCLCVWPEPTSVHMEERV